MLYKYSAFIIIILLDIYVALTIRNYGDKKIRFHMDLIDFLIYVKQQISCFCTPTRRILDEYKAIEIGNVDDNIYLDDRGKEVMNAFFSRLGKSDMDDQISNCDYTIEAINSLLTVYKDEVNAKYKAYSVLTVIGGVMVIILLI